MNSVNAAGEIASQVNFKVTDKGFKITSFILKLSEFYKGKEKTLYVPVTIWGDQGEAFMSQNPTKGCMVLVSGKLGSQLEKAQDKESWRTNIVALHISLLSGGGQYVVPPAQVAYVPPSIPSAPSFADEDIPF